MFLRKQSSNIAFSTLFLIGFIGSFVFIIIPQNQNSQNIDNDAYRKISEYYQTQIQNNSNKTLQSSGVFEKIDNFLVYFTPSNKICSQTLIDIENISLDPKLFNVKRVNLAEFEVDSITNTTDKFETSETINFNKSAFGISAYLNCVSNSSVYIFFNNSSQNLDSKISVTYLDKNQNIKKQENTEISFPKQTAKFASEDNSGTNLLVQSLRGLFLMLMLISFIAVLYPSFRSKKRSVQSKC